MFKFFQEKYEWLTHIITNLFVVLSGFLLRILKGKYRKFYINLHLNKWLSRKWLKYKLLTNEERKLFCDTLDGVEATEYKRINYLSFLNQKKPNLKLTEIEKDILEYTYGDKEILVAKDLVGKPNYRTNKLSNQNILQNIKISASTEMDNYIEDNNE